MSGGDQVSSGGNPEDVYATDGQLLRILAEAAALAQSGGLSPAEAQLADEITIEAQRRGLI